MSRAKRTAAEDALAAAQAGYDKLMGSVVMLTPDDYRAIAARDMTEAVLQTRVQELATSLGWAWYHPPDNRPGGRAGRVQRVVAGWPDLVLVRGRRILYRELKTHTGRVSPEQARWHELLTVAGADVAVWRPLDLLDGSIAADLTRE